MSYERARNLAGTFSALLFCTVVGCQVSNDAAKSAPDLPVRRSGQGDATASKKIGEIGPDYKMTVDLARLPAAGSPTPWSCFDLPPAGFALGQAQCTSDASESFEITAAHVRFVCSGHPDYGTVEPRTPLQFKNCASYSVMLYAFEPDLDLAITQ